MSRRRRKHSVIATKKSVRRRHNPYFKKTRKLPIKWIAIILLPLLIGGAITIFLFSSLRFAYNSIDINGTETIEPQAIRGVVEDYFEERRFLFFKPSNRFLFNDQEVQDALNSQFVFESIQIEKEGQGIRIQVIEKTSSLLWYTDGKIYLADLSGIAIRELAPEEKILLDQPPSDPPEPIHRLPKFRDLNDIELKPGESVLSKAEVENMFRFKQYVEQIGIGFSEVQIDRVAGKLMRMKTNESFDILFDSTGDIDLQAQNLETVLTDSIPDRSNLNYIDLRFGDHVYFK